MPVDFSTREGIMKEWDKWVNYYKSGGGGSWPRDAFESLLDYFYDELEVNEQWKCGDCGKMHDKELSATYCCFLQGGDLICDICGYQETPPYAEGDKCELCGGVFK